MKIHSFQHCFKLLLVQALLLIAVSQLPAQNKNPISREDTIAGNNKNLHQSGGIEQGAFFLLPKRSSTAAVSSVSGNLLYKTAVPNITNTLYGLLSGLTVLQGSGEPGNDAAALAIRGVASYNYESYAIFVDGFQTTFNYFQYLSPTEIESISILKDAAAVAPFGMKGANGVIWIVTKRGEIGKPKVQLQVRTGFQQPLNINKPLGSYEYASLYNEAISNDNGRVWTPLYSNAQLDAYKNGTGINSNWYDAVIKKQSPFTTADATFSGGGSAVRYFVMLGVMKDGGLYNVENDDTHSNAQLQQFNIRTNLDFNLFKIFEGKVDIGGRTDDRRYPNYPAAKLWDNLASYPSNIYSLRNDDGTWPGTNIYPDNPLASIRELGYNSTHDRTLQANFTLKEQLDFITKGLYLRQGTSFNTWTRGSYNVTKNYTRILNNQAQTTEVNTNYTIFDDQGTNQYDWKQFEAGIGYDRQFSKSRILAGVNYLQYTYNVDSNQNGAAGLNIKYAYQNIGGRFHYDYNNRFIAEFGFAYSGSDNYAKNNRFGFYPSISGAWNLSQESFLKNAKQIDLLKLRASVGKSGYDNFTGGRYLYQLYYNNIGTYPTGNGDPVFHNGLEQAYVPNEQIFAEQSIKYNVGLDAQVFKILTLTLDAFMDKRSGIVTQNNLLLAVFGISPPYENIGKVTNRGFEASINIADHFGNLNYWASAMASYNTNKIDNMAEIPPVSPNATKTGRSIGTPFGYEAYGFYDITDFNPDGSLKANLPSPSFGNVQPGDIKYKDVNSDNKIDEKDIVDIGYSNLPKLTYAFDAGISISGFDLSILLQGVSGRSINLLDSRNHAIAFINNGNVYALAQDRWAYYPDQGIDTRASASYPRLSVTNNNNNYQNSTFWIKRGNFLRIRNVELGYTLPNKLMNKLGLSNARFFINGVNLVTWSSFLKNYNLDPETQTGYASLKSLNFGFTVNF